MELKKQMVTITMGNVDTWLVGLYQSYIEGVGKNGLGEKILCLCEDRLVVIFDEKGNLAITPTKLYYCYRSWYDRANPVDKCLSKSLA